jgi:hypothetical protein
MAAAPAAFRAEESGTMAAEQFRIDYAVNLVNAFAQPTAAAANSRRGKFFPHISRADIVAGLIERVRDPTKQSQATASLCGPAALLYCILNEHPDVYAQYVMDLFETGEGRIGALKVKPGAECRNYAPPQGKIAPVDWVALASLRDSENTALSYASVDDDVAGITMPHTLASWFRDAGYAGVRNDTNVVFRKGQKEIDACKQDFDLNRDVCLFIGANMLTPATNKKRSSTADHWVVLDAAPQIANGAISLSVYSWGKIVPIPSSGSLSVEDFARNFLGYVSAKPVYS